MTEELLPNEIYLLIGEGDEGSTIWCDHIPNDEMKAVKYTRTQPKYKRADLDDMKYNLPEEDFPSSTEMAYDRAIDDIKSKYGELYAEVKE